MLAKSLIRRTCDLRIPVALALLVFLGGCTRGSSTYEMNITPDDTRYALRYPGVPESPEVSGVDVAVRRETNLLVFSFGTRRLASIHMPREWIARVQASTHHTSAGRVYHWGVSQWETERGEKVDVTLRYFGEDALFIVVDGAAESIESGSVLRFDRDQHVLVDNNEPY